MKNKNLCIAPPSLLFTITFGPLLTLALFSLLIIFLGIIIFRSIRNRKNNKKIIDENFWKYLLIFIVLLIFLSAPFNNEKLYLLKYISAFAALFIGLIILKKKVLIKSKKPIIAAGILLLIFGGAFLYKNSVGMTKESLPVTENINDSLKIWGGCGQGSLF